MANTSDLYKIVNKILGLKQYILGGSDGTPIGNSTDRLRVEAALPSTGGVEVIPALNNKTQYEDMNASTGGVARETTIGTSYTTIYSYSGTGLLYGFLVTLETDNKWRVRVLIDGVDILGSDGIAIDDMDSSSLYGFNTTARPIHLGLDYDGKTFKFQGPMNYPFSFSSSIEIQVRRTTTSKKFRAGLITIHKES